MNCPRSATTQPKTAITTKAKLRSTWNLKTPEYLIILVIASIILLQLKQEADEKAPALMRARRQNS